MIKPFIFVIFFMLVTASNQASGLSVQQQLDNLITHSQQRGLFNGVAYILHKELLIYQKAIGFHDGTKKQMLNTESVFNVGSITKEFSAVGIMLLKEQGRLRLADSLARYDLNLPQWANKIKVKNLLNYTSGLPKFNFANVRQPDDDLKQLRQIQSLAFTPGEGYLYSNHNVFLQIRIIEKITGLSYQTFIKKYFLEPLKMKHSYVGHETQNPNEAIAFNNAYINDSRLNFPIQFSVSLTAKDMLIWLQSLHSGKLISLDSVAQLFSHYAQGSQSALGQGRFIQGQLAMHRHHGSHFNFESLIYYSVKQQLFVILMTNNKNFKLDEIRTAVEAIIVGESFSIPKKSVYLALRQAMYDDVKQGKHNYFNLKRTTPNSYDFDNPSGLTRIGYKLIERNDIRSAIEVFKLLILEFPKHANAYDSLAEGFYLNKQYKQALNNYRQAVKLDEDNKHAKDMVAKLLGIIEHKAQSD